MRAVALVATLLMTACAAPAPDPGRGGGVVSRGPQYRSDNLLLGKADLVLDAGTYSSPAGFEPGLRFELPESWDTVHRAVDAFDLSQPDPKQDAPLVAVVFSAPRAATVAEAVADLRRDGGAAARTAVDSTIGALSATSLDVVGGAGQVYESRDGTIALDAGPHAHLRFLVGGSAGHVLVVAVYAPDGSHWTAKWARALRVLKTVRVL
jgi:hypothetical protein